MDFKFDNVQIVAIIPVLEGNTGTRIYDENEDIYEFSIKPQTCLEKLARNYGKHIPFLREGQGVKKHWSDPLSINCLQTFVPIKVRNSPYGRTSCYGYFNYNLRRDAAFMPADGKSTYIDLFPHKKFPNQLIQEESALYCPIKVEVSIQQVYRKLDSALSTHYSYLWELHKKMQHNSNRIMNF